MPPTRVVKQEVDLPPWTWIHWCEANRDPYLWSEEENAEAVIVGESTARVALRRRFTEGRGKALKRLTWATETDMPMLRGVAAIALGRIGEAESLEVLERLAGDANPTVRRAAYVGLGLLDSPAAETVLMMQKPNNDLLRAAVVAGLRQHDASVG